MAYPEKNYPTVTPIEFKILSAEYTKSYSTLFIILWLILFSPAAIFMILVNFLKKPKLIRVRVRLGYADGTQEIRVLSCSEWSAVLNKINEQVQTEALRRSQKQAQGDAWDKAQQNRLIATQKEGLNEIKLVQEEELKKVQRNRLTESQRERLNTLKQAQKDRLKQAQKQVQGETWDPTQQNQLIEIKKEGLNELNIVRKEELNKVQRNRLTDTQRERLNTLKQAQKDRLKQVQKQIQGETWDQALQNRLIETQREGLNELKLVQKEEPNKVQRNGLTDVQRERLNILKQDQKDRLKQDKEEKLKILKQSIEEVLKQTQEEKLNQEEISQQAIEEKLKSFKQIIQQILKKQEDEFKKASQTSYNQQTIKINVNSIMGNNATATINKLDHKETNEEINNDDGFATFNNFTNFGKESEKTTNKTKGQWVKENEQRIINGRKINRGLFYFGGVIESLSGYGTEPSLVDESYPVTPINTDIHKEPNIYTDESLGYWPSYASLSSGCRGAYLDWLASSRTNPDTPIGYIFIYFYGLERRIIENRTNFIVSEEEFLTIFDEVLRLNKIFQNSRSFNQYSANFLELMVLLKTDLLEPRMGELPKTYNDLSFKIKLAKTINSEQLVGADLAFDWLKNTFDYSLKMPARRCEDEFRQLFKIRFTQKFGSGIAVKPNKTKLQLSYHAASNGIHGVELSVENLPDPSILKSPIKKLIPIAELCAEELSSLSRYLSKSNTSKDDVAALILLPQELADTSNSPIIESFKKWAEHIVQSNEGLTTVKEFWSHTGMPTPKTINKKESDLLIAIAMKANVGIAPDPQFHQTKIKLDGNIVLFSPSYGLRFEPSEEFNRVSVAIKLGAMIATTDGCVNDNEKSVFQRLIEHDNKLSTTLAIPS